MWIAIAIIIYLLLLLFVWAIIYGGSKNDPNRYDDTYPLDKEDQEEK